MTDPMFDSIKARLARDEGIAKTLAKEEQDKWCKGFQYRIRTMLPKGYEGTAEEIRRRVEMPMPPGSPNAIGGTIMGAVRQGLLEWTGKMKAPTGVKSHYRKTQVWRRV